MNAELAEEFVIEANEFYLTDGREELTLLYRIERMVDLQLASSASHGT